MCKTHKKVYFCKIFLMPRLQLSDFMHNSPATSPFKLLQSYDKEDARIYFGRDRESRQLAETLLRSKFILLYGASGTGKTSLIRCGLQSVFSPRDWLPIFVRRGRHFPDSLRSAVIEQYRQRYALRYPGQTAVIPDNITLREAVKRLFQVAYLPVYLILDQFEEIFTIGDEQEQLEFFQCLNDLRLLEEDLFCKVLIVTREEYIAHFYKYEKTVPFLFDHRFRVEKMRHAQLAEVITGTLTYSWPGYPPFKTEEGVAQKIAGNVTDERGEVDLTTLQVYLDRLYRADMARAPQRDHRLFDAALAGNHKLANVLSDFLDEQTRRVSIEHQAGDLPLQILFKMVTSQGTKQHRSIDEIQQGLDTGRIAAPPEKVQACIEKMASPEIRLLNRLRFVQDGTEHFELIHDRLAQQLFGKFNAEEVRQREAVATIENKQKRFAEAADQPKKKQQAEYLTPGELALIQQALNLERLPASSRAFVEASGRYHTQRRRREQMITVLSLAAAALFMLVALFAWQQWRAAELAGKIEKLVSQSLLTVKTDATEAMRGLNEAKRIGPDNPAVLAALHEIYSNNEFYERSFWHSEPVKNVFWPPAPADYLLSVTENALYRWHRDGTLQDSLHLSEITAATLMPDGKQVALATYDGSLHLMTANRFKEKQTLPPIEEAEGYRFMASSSDGQFLVAATFSAVRVYSSGQTITSKYYFETEEQISSIAVHPIEKNILIGYENGTAEIRTLSGKVKKRMKKHEDRVLGFAVSPLDGTLQSVGREGQLIFWKNDLRQKAHQPRANAIVWSRDSSRLFTCGNDYLIKSWSPQGDVIATYRGHKGFVNALAVSPDGQYFASAGEDQVVHLWKTDSKVLQRFGPHQNGVQGIVLLSGSGQMVTASDQGRNDSGEKLNDQGYDFNEAFKAMFELMPRTATFWRTDTGQKIRSLSGHRGGINALTVSPDGQLLATASDDASVIVWSAQGDSLRRLTGHTDKVFDAAFLPDNQHIISVGADSLCLVRKIDGTIIHAIRHPELIRRVKVFPDGKTFATGCYDGVVRVYDMEGHLQRTMQPARPRRVENLAISPDGNLILTGEWSNHARLYTANGDSLLMLSIFAENKTGAACNRSVAFSADGKGFAIGAEGGVVQVYRIVQQQPVLVQTLQHYPKRVILSLLFAPDGKSIFTGSNDRFVRRWWLEQ
jgi:WD40 repeat protein